MGAIFLVYRQEFSLFDDDDWRAEIYAEFVVVAQEQNQQLPVKRKRQEELPMHPSSSFGPSSCSISYVQLYQLWRIFQSFVSSVDVVCFDLMISSGLPPVRYWSYLEANWLGVLLHCHHVKAAR